MSKCSNFLLFSIIGDEKEQEKDKLNSICDGIEDKEFALLDIANGGPVAFNNIKININSLSTFVKECFTIDVIVQYTLIKSDKHKKSFTKNYIHNLVKNIIIEAINK